MSNRDFQRLLKAVHATERKIVPDEAWVKDARKTLLAHVARELPEQGLSRADQLRALVKPFVPTALFQWMRGPVVAVLSVFAVVLGGSIASVSAADRSLPGDWLFPIKLAAEQTRLALTSDKAARLRLKSEFVDRRVEEIKTVAAIQDETKPNRVKEAAENLKRDLITVKQQLNDVTSNASPKDAVEAAKLVDKKSAQIVAELKDVKIALSDEAKSSVSEAEAAAVGTGVKAVAVLIESKDNPESEVSEAEILESLNQRMQILQDQIARTAEQLQGLAGTSTLEAISSSSSATGTASLSATTSVHIVSANMSLLEAQTLLQENKFELVPDKLLQVSKALADADSEIALRASASSTSDVAPTAASSTGDVAPSATSTESGAASSTTKTSASSTTSPP